MCDISANSEYERLYYEAERLQAKLSALILERDELKYHICPTLQAEYMLKLGALEYKVLELQYKILRVKRKIELIQFMINFERVVNMLDIEAQLDDEYREYQERLDEKMEDMNEALKRDGMEKLSPEETKEIRKLYNKIVKKLHPDMNPNVTEQEKELFVRATEAYKNGDLEAIRAIALLIDGESEYKESADSMKEVQNKIDKLNALIDDTERDIRKIKERFPYIYKDRLLDKKWVDSRKKELEEILEEYKEAYAYYNEKLKNMMEGHNDG